MVQIGIYAIELSEAWIINSHVLSSLGDENAISLDLRVGCSAYLRVAASYKYNISLEFNSSIIIIYKCSQCTFLLFDLVYNVLSEHLWNTTVLEVLRAR